MDANEWLVEERLSVEDTLHVTVDLVRGGRRRPIEGSTRSWQVSIDPQVVEFGDFDALARALSRALRQPEPSAVPKPSLGLAPWQERRAKTLFTERLHAPVAVSDVASACRLSRGHFTKSFKESTGQSPHAWVTSHRVGVAMSLMREAELSLADVSLACGFSDQSHFTRVFRQRVGKTPGAWQRLQPRSAS